jgi:hypothetical protein
MVKAVSAQSAAHGLRLHWSPQRLSRILRSQYETCHLLPLEKRPSLSSGVQFLHHMSPSILRAAKGTTLTVFPVNGQWHFVRNSALGHSNSVLFQRTIAATRLVPIFEFDYCLRSLCPPLEADVDLSQES